MTHSWKCVVSLLVVILVLSTASSAGAAVHDLAADWSNTQNPFGVWELRKAPGVPFELNLDWDSTGQLAWADEPFPLTDHVPAWLKYTGTGRTNLTPGDILAHGAEIDRTGTAYTSVVWTSPITGTAVISGGVWPVSNLGRTMTWQLLNNGVHLSEGTLVTDLDATYTRQNPFAFAAGSGGPSALIQGVGVGDQLELSLRSDTDGGNVGDFLDIDLRITTTEGSPAYNATWTGTSGDMPDASCPPWILGVEGTPPPPTLTAGVLTISSTIDAHATTFAQIAPALSFPNPLVIETHARFVTGNTQVPWRTGMRIQWTVDSSGRGNALYIGPSSIFLLSSNQVVGPAVSVPTSDGFHLYRIEVGADDVVKVFHDQVQVLTGSNFTEPSHNGSIPRIQFGDGTNAADGTSEWTLVRHNAHLTGCDQDGDGERIEQDCDDLDPCTWSGAGELCDGRDNDCDGSIDEGPYVAPGEVRRLTVSHGAATELRWLTCGGSSYDVVKGNLMPLRETGSLSVSLSGCLEDDSPAPLSTDPSDPPVSDGFYYLVRAVTSCAVGSYGTSQRDAEISLSADACP